MNVLKGGGRVLSAEAERFFTCYELFRINPNEYNRRELHLACCYFLMSGSMMLPNVGPVLGSLRVVTPDSRVVRFMVWFVRAFCFRGRPMWNDYEMCRWLLTRDPARLPHLYRQVHQPSNAAVWETGHWMLRSVCEQDEVFREQWRSFKALYAGKSCADC